MRRTPTVIGALALAVTVAAGVAACTSDDATMDAPASPEATVSTLPTGFNSDAAQAYCQKSGGAVAALTATWNPGADADDSTQLGEPILSCRFDADEANAATDDDSSDKAAEGTVYVDLVSLYSTQPTLAALAYLSKTELPESGHDRSTADALCASLGGTSHFGPVPLPGSSDDALAQSDDEKSDKKSDEKSDEKDDKNDDKKGKADASGNDDAPVGGLVDPSSSDDTIVKPCVFADGSFIGKWGIAYYASSTIRGTDLAEVFRFDPKEAPDVFPTDTK